ncbi:MAG: hypothetical protein DRI69_04805 [Bacteroidetes bacterium]|nr:MAG: hypothetical protein DRI69_04805 [Bacteroidota bacterium]
MSVSTVEFLSKERAAKLTARVNAFESSGFQYKSSSDRSPIGGTLDPYTGSWDTEQAAHLLSRAMLGATKEQIELALEIGPEATVNMLLEDKPLPEPPINYFNEEDPFTPIGETWIDKPFQQELAGGRYASLYAWTMGGMLDEGISARESLTLFWHNHFVTANINLPKAVYQYITLLRENALGNFKKLTELVTVNPSMLAYLNNSQNTKFAPNENYARELLELFTIGKGDLAGPGDYTTFTELDVKEVARVLTGWRIRFIADTGEMPEGFFNSFFHDTDDKTLSHRFNEATIQSNGENEYLDLIDLIFEHEQASRFICRKLYRWFVYYKIDDTIEQTIIEPMAQILRDNDFDIKPVLQALFLSEHFYDENSLGCIIKNPIDFMLALIKQFSVSFPSNERQRYALWNGIFRFIELLQMTYYFPPSVAGWKAFYQEPAFNQLWINSVTLIIRQLFTDVMATAGFESFDGRFRVDALAFTASMDNPLDPNDLIKGFAEVLFPNKLAQDQIDILKEILIPGLPDFEWTVEYQAYLDNPDNEEVRNGVDSRLRLLIRAMLARPEYHLS